MIFTIFLILAINITAYAGGLEVAGGNNLKFGTAGEFDYYVLEMSYGKDFCATHKNSPECKTMEQNPLLVLHGLWPDRKDDPTYQYSFCGLDKNPLENETWCNPSTDIRSKINLNVFDKMAEVMPGAAED